jgi:hypothetical protein
METMEYSPALARELRQIYPTWRASADRTPRKAKPATGAAAEPWRPAAGSEQLAPGAHLTRNVPPCQRSWSLSSGALRLD